MHTICCADLFGSVIEQQALSSGVKIGAASAHITLLMPLLYLGAIFEALHYVIAREGPAEDRAPFPYRWRPIMACNTAFARKTVLVSLLAIGVAGSAQAQGVGNIVGGG